MAAALLLVLGAAAGEETVARWRFDFPNGDRLHGDLRRIRDGALTFVLQSDPYHPVRVPLRSVARAARLEIPGEAVASTEEIVRLRDDTVLLGRFRGVIDGRVEFDVRAIGTIRIAGDEVAEYMPTEAIVRAYYRSLKEPRSGDPGAPIPAGRFAALWRDLGQSDGADAETARRVLVRAGPHAVVRIAAHLHPLPDAPERLRRLVALLDHDDPGVRDQAQTQLREMRHLAHPVLRACLPLLQAPEARNRVEKLLVAYEADETLPEAVRRIVRAIAVLEDIGTAEARRVIEEVAAGDPGAETVRAAREALQRMGDR